MKESCLCEVGDDDIDTILYNIMTLILQNKYLTEKGFKKSSAITDFTNSIQKD